VQRQSGTQSLGRILRPDRFGDLIHVHPVSLD
jgi:superfamily II DNA or RNA helicase